MPGVNGDNLIKAPWEELVPLQEFLGLEPEVDRNSFVYEPEKG